jgi:hypothetical protein
MRSWRLLEYRSAPQSGQWLMDQPIARALSAKLIRTTSDEHSTYWSLRQQLVGVARTAVIAAYGAYLPQLTRVVDEADYKMVAGLVKQIDKFLTWQREIEDLLRRTEIPLHAFEKLPEHRAARKAKELRELLREWSRSHKPSSSKGDASDHLAIHFIEALNAWWDQATSGSSVTPLFFELAASVCRDTKLFADTDTGDDDIEGWLTRRYRATKRPSRKKGQTGKPTTDA